MHAKVYSVSMILGRYNHKYYVEISDWRRSVSRCGGVHFFFLYTGIIVFCVKQIFCANNIMNISLITQLTKI
jgi:hypothetical protein